MTSCSLCIVSADGEQDPDFLFILHHRDESKKIAHFSCFHFAHLRRDPKTQQFHLN